MLEDVTLPINVIRCDYSRPDHIEYLFQIFSRLNSGGRKLLYQEIRNCVYQGSFNNFLRYYVHTDAWLDFVAQTPEEVDKYRFGNEERVLRFIAFYDAWSSYNSSLVQYLNKYMSTHRQMSEVDIGRWSSLLDESLKVIKRIRGKKDTRKNWNVMECVLVGVAKNIDALRDETENKLTERFSRLMSSDPFGEKMREGVLHGPKVRERMELAISVFGKN